MEWNKQLIEMFKIRPRPIIARFYIIGYRQKLKLSVSLVYRGSTLLYRQEVLVCTKKYDTN